MTNPMLRSLSTLGLLLAAPVLPAQAPSGKGQDAAIEAELMQLLNTPVSGASKREQRLMDSPQSIEVITGEEMRRMGIQRLPDLLKLMTGLDILEPEDGFSVVGMRGVMQQGQPRTVQILVDGVPLYDAFAASIDVANLPVPVDLIDRVEVVRGPSSTLYGANAVVGVIAITTIKGGKGVHGQARLAGGEHHTSRWAGSMSLGFGDFGVSAGLEGVSRGNSGRTGYYVGDTARAWPYVLDDQGRPDRNHQGSAFARGDWDRNGTHVWLEAGEGDRTLGVSQGLTRRRFVLRTFSAGWQQTWSPTFSTTARLSELRHNLNIRMTDLDAASYTQVLLLMGREPVNIFGDYLMGKSSTTQLELQANWDPSKDLHFVFGADTRRVEADPARFLGLMEKDRESASGAFAAMDWTFAQGLTLSLGVRAENETLGGSRTSPRAALVWAPSDTQVFRLGYYTSTRSPQLMEQRTNYFFPFVDATDANAAAPLYLVACRILPNDQLKPEKTDNIELGFRQALGSLTLDLTLYRMRIRDQITQVATGTQTQTIIVPLPPPYPPYVTEDVPVYTNQFQNKGDATNTGAEAALTWAIAKGWTMGLNGRYLDYSQDDAANGPAFLAGHYSYAPRKMATLWLRFASGRWSGYADVQRVGATKVEALTATGVNWMDTREGYFQCDGRVQFEVIKGLQVGAFVRNGARRFTYQGASGPERPPLYQTQSREAGLSLGYRF